MKRRTSTVPRYCRMAPSLVVAWSLLACASTPARPPLESFALHLDYRTGGDAPLSLQLTVFRDGQVRLLSPAWRAYWSQLDDVDLRAFLALRDSAELASALEHLREDGARFACCDVEEVGIFETAASGAAAARAGHAAPRVVGDLIRWANRVGESYFGRRYLLRIAEPASPSLEE